MHETCLSFDTYTYIAIVYLREKINDHEIEPKVPYAYYYIGEIFSYFRICCVSSSQSSIVSLDEQKIPKTQLISYGLDIPQVLYRNADCNYVQRRSTVLFKFYYFDDNLHLCFDCQSNTGMLELILTILNIHGKIYQFRYNFEVVITVFACKINTRRLARQSFFLKQAMGRSTLILESEHTKKIRLKKNC